MHTTWAAQLHHTWAAPACHHHHASQQTDHTSLIVPYSTECRHHHITFKVHPPTGEEVPHHHTSVQLDIPIRTGVVTLCMGLHEGRIVTVWTVVSSSAVGQIMTTGKRDIMVRQTMRAAEMTLPTL